MRTRGGRIAEAVLRLASDKAIGKVLCFGGWSGEIPAAGAPIRGELELESVVGRRQHHDARQLAGGRCPRRSEADDEAVVVDDLVLDEKIEEELDAVVDVG